MTTAVAHSIYAPDELFPPDLDDAGLPVEPDAVDEEPSEPFVDELPGDDWDDWAA